MDTLSAPAAARAPEVERLHARIAELEAALHASESRCDTLLSQMAQGVVIYDATGRAIMANPAAVDILGLPQEAIVSGQMLDPDWALFHEDGRRVTSEAYPVMLALHTGQVVRDLVLGLAAPMSTTLQWLRFQIIPQFDPGATTPTQIYVIFEDITAQRQAEVALVAHAETLSRTNAELTRALRLKDEFLAMMSHELRTPLNTVLGNTEALEEEVYGPINDQQRHLLGLVIQSGRHLLTILNDILDLARIQAGHTNLELDPIELEPLGRRVVQFVQAAAQKKQLKLLCTVTDEVLDIHADERRLIQILVNLLDNAVKFTPTGGTVGLEVTADREQARIMFTVWDTGIGIAEADYGRLFQPFTQIDGRLARQYEGVGLGLTLVRRLVELHGGSISVISTPGQGSRFTVSLPWSSEDNVVALTTQAPLTHLPTWTQAPRVVLVDDHEPTLTLYAEMLTYQGCQVTVARTGAEAVAHVQATHPDVVVLDIQMPGMDGLKEIQRIRAAPNSAAVPILALTALAMPGDRERCLAAGANVYLAKPVSLRTLLTTIQRMLAPPSAAGLAQAE